MKKISKDRYYYLENIPVVIYEGTINTHSDLTQNRNSLVNLIGMPGKRY